MYPIRRAAYRLYNYVNIMNPNWGCRRKGYEAWVMEEFLKTLD